MKFHIRDTASDTFIAEGILHRTEEARTATAMEGIDLVPNEAFVEETNVDNSKKFTCKQCGKVCKTEHSVKQHIGRMHKNQPTKRTASKSDTTHGKKKNQKLIHDDDYRDGPLHSTRLGDLSTNIDNYEFEEEMKLKENDGSFQFNATVEKFLHERKKATSEGYDDIDLVEEMTPDQDHDYLANENVNKDEANDFDMLRAMNISLKLELDAKNTLINEKDNDLKVAQLEITEQIHLAQSLREDNKIKDDAFITASAQINSLEEKKKMLESKLREYTDSLRALIKERDDKNAKPNKESPPTEREKELSDVIKEKNKAIKTSETAQKRLAAKLSELETNVNENKSGTDAKYKKTNDQLSLKTKEAKKYNDDLKKAEKRAIELMDTVSEKNKKIYELDNENVRLRLMKDQAKEIIDKVEKAKPKSTSDVNDAEKKKKCKFENTGNCRNRECKDAHSKKTCQSFSKLGSCPLESTCEHRHPFGICFDWERHGQCFKADGCRNRHPLEMSSQRTPDVDPFLGQGSPSGAHREAEGWRAAQPGQRSPGQIRHHDQRGKGRW